MKHTRGIGHLVKHFGLSRSTVLYYEEIGLLKPAARSAAGYRQYGPAQMQRLEQILQHRAAGLSLQDIARVLDAGEDLNAVNAVLKRRVQAINGEINALRAQQRLLLSALTGAGRVDSGALDQDTWVAVLRASGLDRAARRRWHIEFERLAPGAHRDFLGSLGFSHDDIEAIRAWRD